MKISDYVPKLYKNNTEMINIIDSEEEEFEEGIKQDIDNTFNNTFALKANEEGLRRYEALLGITLDENKDNLEYRRARILSKLGTSGVLTRKWLEENLTSLVGKNNYQIDLDTMNYLLNINISDVYSNTASTLFNIYRPLIPSNLELFVNLFDNINNNLYISNVLHEGEILLIKGDE